MCSANSRRCDNRPSHYVVISECFHAYSSLIRSGDNQALRGNAMSFTPIYDDVMRELEGIMEASKAKRAAEKDEKAAERKLDGPIAS
jgi:hypothetical protein